MQLERRAFLRGLALLAGGGLSASCTRWLAEAEGASRLPSRRILDPTQRELLASAAELVIPATDTPGARGAGVPDFIEMMLVDWLDEAERGAFLAGLGRLDSLAREGGAEGFAGANEGLQTRILTDLEREAGARPPEQQGLLSQTQLPVEAPRAFFPALKELVVVGYYTSEVGAARELAFRVAGSFEACLPFAGLGRAWSE